MHVHSIGTPTLHGSEGYLLRCFIDSFFKRLDARLLYRRSNPNSLVRPLLQLFLSLHCNRHISNLVSVLNLQDLDVFGHLVDLLRGDRFLLSVLSS